jgi:hypothetical protein
MRLGCASAPHCTLRRAVLRLDRVPLDTKHMVVRPRALWTIVGSFVVLSGSAVAAGAWVVGVVLLLPIVWASRMRLSADDAGMTVVNCLRTFRVPWSEVRSVELGRVLLLSYMLKVFKRDGGAVNVWVTTIGYRGDYSSSQVMDFASRLERMRAEAMGELPPQASHEEIERALTSAQAGDPGPLDGLLASHRLDPELYSELLHRRAAAGQLDLDRLRANRRARMGMPRRTR